MFNKYGMVDCRWVGGSLVEEVGDGGMFSSLQITGFDTIEGPNGMDAPSLHHNLRRPPPYPSLRSTLSSKPAAAFRCCRSLRYHRRRRDLWGPRVLKGWPSCFLQDSASSSSSSSASSAVNNAVTVRLFRREFFHPKVSSFFAFVFD
nr:hypothetical protein CFP56_18253 [Quercus suber]